MTEADVIIIIAAYDKYDMPSPHTKVLSWQQLGTMLEMSGDFGKTFRDLKRMGYDVNILKIDALTENRTTFELMDEVDRRTLIQPRDYIIYHTGDNKWKICRYITRIFKDKHVKCYDTLKIDWDELLAWAISEQLIT